MDIIAWAFRLADAVERFAQHARHFCYEVMLLGYACPTCSGSLEMLGEGRCRCGACGTTLDPTLAFQRCTACDGKPRLRRWRYECQRCGSEIVSRFLFDGLVFDREYFRKRMAESRQRRKEEREHLRTVVGENRSPVLEPSPVDIESMPGLVAALDGLAMLPEAMALLPVCKGFDLQRYERHLQAHIGDAEVRFDDIPALEEDPRKDRIWRFVGIIFMAHSGAVDVWQEGDTIMVMRYETDREGQGVPGASEATDGV
jgi:hypothetical protein